MPVTTEPSDRSLTVRLQRTVQLAQALVFLAGVATIVAGVLLIADEAVGAGIAVIGAGLTSALAGYSVLMYIEWQVARAVLEHRHAGSSPADQQ